MSNVVDIGRRRAEHRCDQRMEAAWLALVPVKRHGLAVAQPVGIVTVCTCGEHAQLVPLADHGEHGWNPPGGRQVGEAEGHDDAQQ